jgi:hypothetical protein
MYEVGDSEGTGDNLLDILPAGTEGLSLPLASLLRRRLGLHFWQSLPSPQDLHNCASLDVGQPNTSMIV